jgi:hypothetical protein
MKPSAPAPALSSMAPKVFSVGARFRESLKKTFQYSGIGPTDSSCCVSSLAVALSISKN